MVTTPETNLLYRTIQASEFSRTERKTWWA